MVVVKVMLFGAMIMHVRCHHNVVVAMIMPVGAMIMHGRCHGNARWCSFLTKL